MIKTFILTNHNSSEDQIADLKNNWAVSDVVVLPANLKDLWGAIPPEIESVAEAVQPVIEWLSANCSRNDLVWVQGEWGATFEVLRWCSQNSVCAIYSTTKRVATEVKTDKGTVMTHVFKHVRFRKFPIF